MRISKLLIVIGIAMIILFAAIRNKAMTQTTATAPANGIVVNPGFEYQTGTMPVGWIIDEKVKDRGIITLDTTQKVSGKQSLKISPNASNTDKSQLLGIGQMIPVDSLKGKRLRIGGFIKTTDGTGGAIIAITVGAGNKISSMVLLNQEWQRSDFIYQDRYITIKNDARALIVGCYATGASGSAWFDDISLSEDPPIEAIKPTQGLKASIDINTKSITREIPRSLFGTNLEWAWDANGLWDANHNRLRPEILNPSREMGLSTVRFPGGFLSDYYHWRNGVGPIAKRPLSEHSPGADRSPNVMGTDELVDFCNRVGAKPLISVNIITGTAQEAADWVLYCNQPGNKERIANGHIRPYGVEFWEIGNEQYLKGDDGVGITSHLPCEEYIRRLKEWSAAMRKADPTIKIIAVGASNYGRNTMTSDENWNRKLLEGAGDSFDYLAVHNAYQPVDASGSGASFYEVYQALMAHPLLVSKHLKSIQNEIEEYAPKDGHTIRIGITEWAPLFAVVPSDKWIDHCKTLGSGIYVASLMKAFIESPNVELTNSFKLCEYSFMGWIGGDGTPKPSYYAFQMYAKHFGTLIVPSSVKSPTYNSKGVSLIDAVKGVPYIEAVSSLSADKSKLYVIVINKNIKSPIDVQLSIDGFKPAATAKVWTLTAPSIDVNNGKDLINYPGLSWAKQIHAPDNSMFERGKPGTAVTRMTYIRNTAGKFHYAFQPISVTCIEMD